MSAIPFPVSSSPGQKGQEGAGRLVNCYAEKTEPGARNPVLWKRVPGMIQRHDVSSHDHLRGGIYVASTLVAVFDDRVHTVTKSGASYSSTNRGALSGSDKVTIARNNASTPNIACVAAAGAFNLFIDNTPSSFADADIGSPNSVSSHHGYLMFTQGGGKCVASDLNSVNVSSSSFTTEQNAGTILRGIEFEDEWLACGSKAIGIYYDAGTSPFPLARRGQIDSGIAGTHAIAASDALIWACPDGTVRMKRGLEAVIISNADVSRDVYSAIYEEAGADLEAETYTHGNNSMWSLTRPGYWTWEYNITTQNWNERQSYGRNDWRCSTIVPAFDQWICGDRVNSKLYAIDPTYYREGVDPLVFDLTSGAAAGFPARLGAPRADFDFTAGVGQSSGEDPIQTDPSVLVSVSRDGGASWGDPVARKLGSQGVYGQPVTVNRCGLSTAKGFRFRLQVSDPVHVAFGGAQLATQQRAA